MNVLTTWVASVDPTGLRGGVPAVDGGVVLQTGVGTLPRRVGDLAEEVAGRHRAHGGSVDPRRELPVAPVNHGFHELVGDPYRVVGVLVLRRVAVRSVQVHVEPGVAQDARLALLDGLTPDEVLYVRVVDVEDDHLGGASCLAALLDGPGRGVGAPHEADRTRGRATT